MDSFDSWKWGDHIGVAKKEQSCQTHGWGSFYNEEATVRQRRFVTKARGTIKNPCPFSLCFSTVIRYTSWEVYITTRATDGLPDSVNVHISYRNLRGLWTKTSVLCHFWEFANPWFLQVTPSQCTRPSQKFRCPTRKLVRQVLVEDRIWLAGLVGIGATTGHVTQGVWISNYTLSHYTSNSAVCQIK